MNVKIKSLKVIPSSMKKESCHFCNGTKKLKYIATIVDGGQAHDVQCCTACAYKYSESK